MSIVPPARSTRVGAEDSISIVDQFELCSLNLEP
jgi:hypothetical protein